jgi:tryptophan synthase alpha chain
MPNRIDTWLEAARSAGKTALGPFVTVGYPDVETSVEVAASVLREGVDLIELGVPFSDPLAEGPTIQKTSYRALENGVDLPICLEAVRRLRGRGLETPIVFMGYYNPFLRYGLSRFASDAVAAGADGVIVPDLPTEESRDMRERCAERGLHLIPLLAPTSTDPRIELACANAGGFIYCVSVTGVTGARTELRMGVSRLVERIRQYTDLPVLVGFGVSRPEHVTEIGSFADGAVVGSALMDAVGGVPPDQAPDAAAGFVRALRGSTRPS